MTSTRRVETKKHSGTYRQIDASEVPERIRFDTPRRNQGQGVEYAYALATFGRGEADEGDLYMRRRDSDGTVTYHVRVCDGCGEPHDAWTRCARRRVSRSGIVSWSR